MKRVYLVLRGSGQVLSQALTRRQAWRRAKQLKKKYSIAWCEGDQSVFDRSRAKQLEEIDKALRELDAKERRERLAQEGVGA